LNGDVRAKLLEIAAAWDQLAKDSEKRSGGYFGSRSK
jgi:hypothetical protein